jgi:hypothetical protein
VTVETLDLARFVGLGVAQLEDEIVRAEDARREQRRFKRLPAAGAPGLNPAALGSLVRVLERRGARTVRDLGVPAAVAWAKRVGI